VRISLPEFSGLEPVGVLVFGPEPVDELAAGPAPFVPVFGQVLLTSFDAGYLVRTSLAFELM
jgi:hypothetical protein